MHYADQQKIKCFEDIAQIKESLPVYAGMYIDAVATRKDTSYRTGRAYAYDLQIFFRYLRDVKGETSPTPAYLDSLLGEPETDEEAEETEEVRKPYGGRGREKAVETVSSVEDDEDEDDEEEEEEDEEENEDDA